MHSTPHQLNFYKSSDSYLIVYLNCVDNNENQEETNFTLQNITIPRQNTTLNSLDFLFPIDSCKNREAGTLRELNFLFKVSLN